MPEAGFSSGVPMSPILTIDVAHPPRSPQVVEEELLDACSEVRRVPTLRLLKIIHGYGGAGRGSKTKEVVRNWLFRNKQRFNSVIEGERYNLSDPETQELRKVLGTYPDTDLGSANPGITLVWIK